MRDPQTFPAKVWRARIRSARTKVTVVVPRKLKERLSRQSNQAVEDRLRNLTPREVMLPRQVAYGLQGACLRQVGRVYHRFTACRSRNILRRSSMGNCC